MLKSIIMIGIILKVASILTFHILYSLYLDYVRLYNLYVYKIGGRKNLNTEQLLSILKQNTEHTSTFWICFIF